MDLISLYYFSEMAKDLHITRTANRLFVSQQTLSNHLARLEEYYGTRLLHRKPSLSLTCAGEFVLAFAEVVQKEHTNLRDILSDVEHQERGVLRFGASPLRVNACLPEVLPRFSQRYPNVEVRVTDEISEKLEPLVLSGELDFAAVLSCTPKPELVAQKLMVDPVYLCVPDELLRRYYPEQAAGLKAQAIHGVRIESMARLPLCLHNNRLGQRLTECFTEQGVAPRAYLTSSDTQVSLSMCGKGLAACFATHMSLVGRRGELPKSVNVFPLHDAHDQPITQTLSLIRRKDRYLARYAKLFLELLEQYFARAEGMHMERVV